MRRRDGREVPPVTEGGRDLARMDDLRDARLWIAIAAFAVAEFVAVRAVLALTDSDSSEAASIFVLTVALAVLVTLLYRRMSV